MPVTVIPQEGGLFDPDDIKMPESPDHRKTIDAIGLASSMLLGDEHQIFRDMNWYPADGGTALAPDLMVLPAGAFVPPPGFDPDDRLKSYRQDKTGGPSPSVVVEVPSDSKSYIHLRTKALRYCALGAVVYVVLIDPPGGVDRYSPDRPHLHEWGDQPLAELGGIRVEYADGEATVITPDGLRATSDADLLTQIAERADRAQAQADG